MLALGLLLGPISLGAAEKSVSDSRKVTTPNYELAARFSAKNVNRMVFTTEVRPLWMRHSESFIYEWKTSAGTNYYLADPVKGSVRPVFDMDRLAMELTSIKQYLQSFSTISASRELIVIGSAVVFRVSSLCSPM